MTEICSSLQKDSEHSSHKSGLFPVREGEGAESYSVATRHDLQRDSEPGE